MSPVRTLTTHADAPGVLQDWVSLTKPRIGSFVLFSSAASALLAGAEFGRAVEAALWVLCLAAAASVFNQVLERDTDRLMTRTANRPLATGRIRIRDAVFFGAALATAGTLALALRFNLLSALLGLGTLCAYALVYTPLKRVSSLNTVFGALPGAMPPMLGAVAVAGAPTSWGWLLFAVVFAWQFPHFLAIAFLYREDYARAGLKMLPALEGTRGMAGRQALLYSLVLLPISILPVARAEAGIVYVAGACALGFLYVGASLAFALQENARRARLLLLTSLGYLPILLLFALIDPLVRFATSAQ